MEKVVQILDHTQISVIIERLACQIVEHNLESDSFVVLGVAERGYHLAQLIAEKLPLFGNAKIVLGKITVNKDAPLLSPINCDLVLDENDSRTIILIDDVLNSGATLSAAFSFLLNFNPSKISTTVLANRNHRRFPINADFVGIDMATTLKEHIVFNIGEENNMSVKLH